MLFLKSILLIGILCASVGVRAQSDTLSQPISAKYLDQVSSKAGELEQKLDRQSEKVLSKFLKAEQKLQRKLSRKDSAKAQHVFGGAGQQYAQLQDKLAKADKLKQYIPSLDTLSSSLKFLQTNPQLMAITKEGPAKLKEAMGKVNGLQTQFQKAEEIKKFLRERKEYLKSQLNNLGLGKQLKQLNKQAYYYSAQVNEYKQLLKDCKCPFFQTASFRVISFFN